MNLIFPIIVVLSVPLALMEPKIFLWGAPLIVPMLGIIMFGMGFTLHPKDFTEIIKAPKIIFIGLLTQYIIMAGAAYVIAHLFRLPPSISIGIILVGTCPGGTSSNVITLLAKGDVALSVSMTTCSTLLSPILTPILTMILGGHWINVNATAMFFSIIKIVIIPVILGMTANKLLNKYYNRLVRITPFISMTAIVLIIGAVVALNAERLITIAALTMLAVILHNLIGLAAGFYIAKSAGFKLKQCKTLSIEVGLQNSGLAASLAKTHFPSIPEAMLPAAFFSIWHNLSGAILAWFWKSKIN